MEIGITGLAGAGKTTVFNALARAKVEVATFGTVNAEPNRAVVHVPDERLDRLAELFKPKKVTPAEVRYVDVAGGVDAEADASRASQITAHLRNADALLLVVRAFENEAVPHPKGKVDPLRDAQELVGDLMLNDLAVAEKRLERLERDLRFSKQTGPTEATREREVMRQIKEQLDAERPIRELPLTATDLKLLRGYGFLTAKPWLIVLNVGDSQENAPELVDQVRAAVPFEGTEVTSLAGKLEMELAELDPEEAADFMAALGITELGLNRVIQVSYRLLDYISFFTVGPDECRAWTVKRNTPAPEAAGVIHSDFTRGFIRAEVIGWKELLEAGGWTEAKRKGQVRLEGKTYVVEDGDVINILFNV